MTSDPKRLFVWTWLPDSTTPVVAGALDDVDGLLIFSYGRSYLERENAVPLYLPDLPLERGDIRPLAGTISGVFDDAAPDAWGMRVILNRRLGRDAVDDVDLLPKITYLIESGSDRVGALDFQLSADEYVPRGMGAATLDELAEAADRVQNGIPLSPELDQALLHGSSVGGARPKAVLRDGERDFIAKFSSTTDMYPIVKGEYISMELAKRAGLDVANVKLTSALGKDVLLVERFDRQPGGRRRAMVSALTILTLDEMSGRYAAYADIAQIMRARFNNPEASLRELFARITFNILTGNNDDHARNHAAFWDGQYLTLTPAYDISPQPRAGGETQQLMGISEDGWRYSQVEGCAERALTYSLTEGEARSIIDQQIDTIETQWNDVADLAGLTRAEKESFWHRQYLNPYATEGYRSRVA
jgi:serine/threonine-protein kinase HipA